MPALSPTMSAGNLTKWYVKVGDEVGPGTVLADVETDKAVMAFENQEEGFVARLLVPDGSRDVPVGTPVAIWWSGRRTSAGWRTWDRAAAPARRPARRLARRRLQQQPRRGTSHPTRWVEGAGGHDSGGRRQRCTAAGSQPLVGPLARCCLQPPCCRSCCMQERPSGMRRGGCHEGPPLSRCLSRAALPPAFAGRRACRCPRCRPPWTRATS
jgi:hypothetical protein